MEADIIRRIKKESYKSVKRHTLPFYWKYLATISALILITFSMYIFKLYIFKKHVKIQYPDEIIQKIEKFSAKNEIPDYFEESRILLSNIKEKDLKADEISIAKSKKLLKDV